MDNKIDNQNNNEQEFLKNMELIKNQFLLDKNKEHQLGKNNMNIQFENFQKKEEQLKNEVNNFLQLLSNIDPGQSGLENGEIFSQIRQQQNQIAKQNNDTNQRSTDGNQSQLTDLDHQQNFKNQDQSENQNQSYEEFEKSMHQMQEQRKSLSIIYSEPENVEESINSTHIHNSTAFQFNNTISSNLNHNNSSIQHQNLDKYQQNFQNFDTIQSQNESNNNSKNTDNNGNNFINNSDNNQKRKNSKNFNLNEENEKIDNKKVDINKQTDESVQHFILRILKSTLQLIEKKGLNEKNGDFKKVHLILMAVEENLQLFFNNLEKNFTVLFKNYQESQNENNFLKVALQTSKGEIQKVLDKEEKIKLNLVGQNNIQNPLNISSNDNYRKTSVSPNSNQKNYIQESIQKQLSELNNDQKSPYSDRAKIKKLHNLQQQQYKILDVSNLQKLNKSNISQQNTSRSNLSGVNKSARNYVQNEKNQPYHQQQNDTIENNNNKNKQIGQNIINNNINNMQKRHRRTNTEQGMLYGQSIEDLYRKYVLKNIKK
ncbi:hypothetical protein PPERSA_05566 [Pseudocohnilembus persalinus]|uniref:Uncharacterized protein n=1 Tax=Pseudocohnilembus persalinus TaxID=266149 RepID=A0A0V0Q7Q5_PSEPJ|nr:hypothetical protein PPERSA_05566 [Pseudocohnilembus persalinus]|eukprot:KRW98222.1 hypothetical protein PPERSA_05566 [Pseudocohnilembus persalinus]